MSSLKQKIQFNLDNNRSLIWFFLRILLTKRALRKNNQALVQLGLGKHLNELSLKQHKTSDTVFIMGSGSSINDIKNNEWDLIKKHNSIGLNFWPIHPFVPSFYFFEMPREISHRIVLFDNIKKRANDYKKTPCIIKKVFKKDIPHFKKLLPRSLLDNFFFAETIDIIGKINREKDLIKELNRLKMFGFLSRKNKKINTLFQQKASIAYLILFAFMCGYKNIVLCGVDLKNNHYFFDGKESYYTNQELKIPKIHRLSSKHKTMNNSSNSMAIDKIILIINNHLLKPNNVNLFIGSKKSALYPRLKYYF